MAPRSSTRLSRAQVHWLDAADRFGADPRKDVHLQPSDDLGGVRLGPGRGELGVPLACNFFEAAGQRQAGCDPLFGVSLDGGGVPGLLAHLARIHACADELSCLLGLLASQAEARARVGAQAERLAAATDAVVEAPAVRSALHEQQQVEARAVAQATSRVTRLDRLDRGVRGDEVVRHAVTPQPIPAKF